MQQQCKACGYESPEADQFCRQCGGSLSAKSESSASPIGGYGRGEPNPSVVSAGTGRFPSSVGDAIAGDTARYYYPPQYAPAPGQMAPPPSYAPVPPVPSPRFQAAGVFFKGAFYFLLVAALLAATAGAVFFAQEAQNERRRRNDLEMRVRGGGGGNNANERAQGAWEHLESALTLLNEAAERAAGAGATISTGSETAIDLGKYAFPDAQVEATVAGRGNEALSLLTRQNFEEVRSFYERQFGKPVIQAQVGNYPGNNRKRLLFQSAASPTVLIKIEEMEEDRVKMVKITILRSLLRFSQGG
ncbi:MAG: hypothetical protein ACKVX9_09245 [Blastocatellia bacterium]